MDLPSESEQQETHTPWTELWSQQVQNQESSQQPQTEQSHQPTQTEQWSTNLILLPQEQVKPADTEGTVFPPNVALDPALDFEQLYGVWRIWASGTVLQGKPVPGAHQGELEISRDGTYKMSHAVWAKDGLAGMWRLSFPGEINGLRIIAIVLLNADGSSNWAVSYAGEDRANLMSALDMPDGTAFWVASNQLYRE
jgi:hypothetical protein